MSRASEPTRRSGLIGVRDDAEIVLYDFRRPTKLSRDHVRVLQMSFETFARRLGTLLTSSLRVLCQINLLAIDQQNYEEYILGLNTPTVLAPFTAKPLAGTSVLEFSLGSALSCVDHMLGGSGGPQPARTLTEIESVLVLDLVEQILGALKYSLEPIVAIEPRPGELEFNPPFLQAAGTTDAMIVVSFETRIGSEVGVATLCIPFAAIFARLQSRGSQRSLSATEQQVVERSAQRVRTSLGDVPLDVSVEFEPVRLSPARIAELSPGDVITLNHRVMTPLSVRCGDFVFTKAIPGREGNRLAGLVVDKKLGS
jgi:flagellar motor switch protein FliM